MHIPSSQPPQYVPPSSKSKRPPFICGRVVVEPLFSAFVGDKWPAVVVDAEPGEFGAATSRVKMRIIICFGRTKIVYFI